MALINSFGALGSFVGTIIVGHLNETRGYGASYLFMAVSLLVAAVITIIAVKKPDHLSS
jgi:predicted MFS family arabinose efflux permease